MDWIKQIIECKKGNWESPGSLGQKIKKIRMLRRYTQKELGVMCGFSLSSADVRIAQYEKNKKIPREKILKAMCNALGVGEGALVHADMLSYQEMFYALFDMEDFHGLHPVKKEDGYYLRFGSDSIINDFLEEWYKMYQKYPRPRGDDEEEKYTLCRYEYPNEIAVVSQYELLKRKALQAEIENLQLKINDLENDFCEEYLGEDYDYVFSIHTDQKHMHGHIVFNSVNRMSGYKYRYEKKDWEKYIQPLTDRICEKYGLPPLVYDKNNKIGKSYAAHYAEKEGRPSSEKIIKADIDFVIASSKDWDDFIRQMEGLGYKIRQKKYVTYIPPGFERGRRDSRLGPGYRAEEIKERIKNKGQEQGVEKILSHELSKVYEREIFQYTKTTLTVFQMKKIKNFYQTGHYLEEKNPYAVAWKEVRRNAVHIDQLYEECKYILEHEIKTEKDLLEKQKILIKKEAELFNQRRTLFSVEDKKIFQQYRVLKKRLADTPDWDDQFEIYQEELNDFLKEMPEGMLSAEKEKRQINAMLREVRNEKRIVNRMIEEEKSLNKEEKITKKEGRTEIQHRR